jgi:hypothetical protein
VLDAVRIAGRWVCKHLLARLSAQALSDKPPVRANVVREFCRRTNWRNRKGRLCYASANVALNRLEKRGMVKLPMPAPRAARKQPRRLVNDGKPLPRAPRLGPRLPTLTLQLIQNQEDPDHGLWNRLIIREHPLKDAPLVGAQLRYLLRSPEGVIGAFGIGPASYHLECRDLWIGWDHPTRLGHLSQVVGLARFLIRPEVSIPNLASHAYRLLVQRVPKDWKARYGLEPVLMETFVDRSTQTGTSLSAANWRRLGQSRGYGRSPPTTQADSKSRKDVWVCELALQARKTLLERPVPRVVPRSLFHSSSTDCWAREEMDGLALGDTRLEKRFALMLQSRWENPERSFFRGFGGVAAGKAAYRLIESPRAEVSFGSLLAPHEQQTHRRMAAETLILLAQDTTAVSYNTLHQTTGLGPVGDKSNPGRGLWLHTMQAFRTDGIPLGCAWAKLWARESTESDTEQRNEQSVDEKESVRWIEAYQQALRLAQAMPQTHLFVCGDRESDTFDLFDQTESAPSNLHLLARAQHDRILTDGPKLWHQLLKQKAQGRMKVRVPRRGDRPAREATLELRWAAVEIAPPRVALKKSWEPITLYAVLAREIQTPDGQEPIEWLLLTDWKVESLKMAIRMVKWYGLRWGIECWHQVLKDVCHVEKRQMESAQALERALVLDMIVAWRALKLCRLGKEHPALKASLFYSQEELAVLEEYKHKLPRHARSEVNNPVSKLPPAPGLEQKTEERTDATGQSNDQAKATAKSKGEAKGKGMARGSEPSVNCSSLSLFQANLLVAMLAGFWGRKSDGHPGPKLVAAGLIQLATLVNYRRMIEHGPSHPLPRSNRPREPG